MFSTFPIDKQVPAKAFISESREKLTKLGIIDLGPTNVGYFPNEPTFRWIDAQPSNIESMQYYKCIKLSAHNENSVN